MLMTLVVHLLLREIVRNLLLLLLMLLQPSAEGVSIHVWNLTCRYLKPQDFFSQGIIQSCTEQIHGHKVTDWSLVDPQMP